MLFKFFIKKFDWVLFLIPVCLIALSVLIFYSLGPTASKTMYRQIVFLFLGIIAIIGVSFFDYRIFKNYSAAPILLYLFTILLLLITFKFGNVRGVNSWLILGRYRFEPSELAKLAVIILLAKYFSQKHVEIYNYRHIVASGAYVVIPAFLTFIQPDLGSAIIFITIWIAMLFSAGIKRRHLAIIFLVGVVIISLAWFTVLKPYQKSRITSFINPYLDPKGEGYNIIQSKTTVGAGRIFGTMFRKDLNLYPVVVPEPYTDFAFAVFSQKFGLLGVVLIFILFWLMILRAGSIANMAHNNFSKLFVIGFLTMLLSHFLINAGMNIGLLPITGIPFPFLSYGGSFLITLMLGLGLIESIKLRT